MVEILAPGDDVGSGDQAQLNWGPDAGKGHELFKVVSVRAARVRVIDVRKPLGSGGTSESSENSAEVSARRGSVTGLRVSFLEVMGSSGAPLVHSIASRHRRRLLCVDTHEHRHGRV